MNKILTTIDVKKLERHLRLVRIKSRVAIALGDCRAVARLTCETCRLRDAINLAEAVVLQPS
jgi:hypothetical protein